MGWYSFSRCSGTGCPNAPGTTVNDPTIVPTGGSYSPSDYPKSVTMQSVGNPNSNSGIYLVYTTDGTTPTYTSQTNYHGTLVLSNTKTVTVNIGGQLKVLAVSDLSTNSNVISSGSYNSSATCATPTYSPVCGHYNNDQFPKSIIMSSDAGSTIYYTTNNTTPIVGVSSSVATGSAVSVSANQFLRAIAHLAGNTDSPEQNCQFIADVSTCATPTYSPVAGTYNNDQFPKSIAVTSTTSGVTIYYTTDGSTPTTGSSSVANGGSVSVSANQTLKAMAHKTAWNDSAVASGQYVAQVFTVATPTYSPTAGTYGDASYPKSVAITSSTSGATIHYTLDGSTPTGASASVANGGSVSVSAGQTLKAIGTKTAWNNSAVASGTYSAASIATPTVTPNGGSSSCGGTATLATSTPGCYLRYFISSGTPTTPTCSSGTLINASSGVVTMCPDPNAAGTDYKVKVIACQTGYNPSAVTTSGTFLCPVCTG